MESMNAMHLAVNYIDSKLASQGGCRGGKNLFVQLGLRCDCTEEEAKYTRKMMNLWFSPDKVWVQFLAFLGTINSRIETSEE